MNSPGVKVFTNRLFKFKSSDSKVLGKSFLNKFSKQT